MNKKIIILDFSSAKVHVFPYDENDIWCVVLCEGGAVKHYRSDQIKIHFNGTFDIK